MSKILPPPYGDYEFLCFGCHLNPYFERKLMHFHMETWKEAMVRLDQEGLRVIGQKWGPIPASDITWTTGLNATCMVAEVDESRSSWDPRYVGVRLYLGIPTSSKWSIEVLREEALYAIKREKEIGWRRR